MMRTVRTRTRTFKWQGLEFKFEEEIPWNPADAKSLGHATTDTDSNADTSDCCADGNNGPRAPPTYHLYTLTTSRNVLHSRAYSRDGLLLLMRQTTPK